MTRLPTFLLAAALFVGGARAADGAPVAEYALKADFVERFTRFVEWPPLRLPTDESAFVACVIGEDPMGMRLEELARTRRFKGHRVEVLHPDTEALASCHLLWIAATDPSTLGEILLRTARRPILTLGDTPGYAELGVMIALRADGAQLRFQINRSALDDAGLTMSPHLLRLGELVGEGR